VIVEPTDPESRAGTAGHVAAVLKAIRVVEELEHAGPLAPAELARRTGNPPATMYRLLGTLEHAGWAERRGEGYALSVRLAQLASAEPSRSGLRRAARPILRALSERTGETVYLAVRVGDEVLCLDRIESSSLVRVMTWDVGQQLPLRLGAVSLAILAHLPEEEAVRIAAVAEDRDELLAVLAEVRATGASISVGEVAPGVASVGAPVLDRSGSVIAAISIGGLAPAIQNRQDELSRAAKRAAEDISRVTGHAGSPGTRSAISPSRQERLP
jgi:DNA-binding IclR family transcriptional regulator